MIWTFAIDPGTEYSAYAGLVGPRRLAVFGRVPNEEMLELVACAAETGWGRLAVEMVASYGMPVGAEVFETVLWAGRFAQAWVEHTPAPWARVYRHEVKMHLCHNTSARDANIRRALIDLWGGDAAVGRKKAPGPLYGVAADEWQALGVAVTHMETKQ